MDFNQILEIRRVFDLWLNQFEIIIQDFISCSLHNLSFNPQLYFIKFGLNILFKLIYLVYIDLLILFQNVIQHFQVFFPLLKQLNDLLMNLSFLSLVIQLLRSWLSIQRCFILYNLLLELFLNVIINLLYALFNILFMFLHI